jgi:hypothetical protein
VLAGDTLTRGLFDWYEAAGRLSTNQNGFVPSEGVAAIVLEAPGRTRARARLLDARWLHPDRSEELPEDAAAATLVSKGQSLPPGLRSVLQQTRFAPVCPVADGLSDTGGLFRILTALGTAAPAARLLVLGASTSGACATVLLEAPVND